MEEATLKKDKTKGGQAGKPLPPPRRERTVPGTWVVGTEMRRNRQLWGLTQGRILKPE